MSSQYDTPPLLSQVRLRQATPNDLVFARQLILDNMDSYIRNSGYQWDDQEFERGWALTFNIIVVRDDQQGNEERIGLVRLHINQERTLIWELQVIPSCQRQGLGQYLLDRVISTGISSGSKELLLEVFRDNPAISLYQRAGFQVRYESEYLFGMFRPLA